MRPPRHPEPDNSKHQVALIIESTVMKSGAHVGDLLWIDGVPTLVLEWADVPDGEYPAVTVPLDPDRLYVSGPHGVAELHYLRPVQDPR